MRRIRYSVAMSLDGYVAGPKDEMDWILVDPEIDFAALFKEFDTALVGRRTFEVMARAGQTDLWGLRAFVFSKTLRPHDYPNVTVIADRAEEIVAGLRKQPGKDIWLFGGGQLFRSLQAAGLVDTVEVAVIPVLLGGGVPLLPPPAGRVKLELTGHKLYKNGTVSLSYAVK